MNVKPQLVFSAHPVRGGLSMAALVAASISGLVFLSAPADAAIYTYTAPNSTTTGTWSSGTNWSAVPVSAVDTTLVFAGSFATTANTATSQDNIAGAFQLNAMTLSASEATNFVTATYNITPSGGTLNFVSNSGTAPVVNLNSSNGTFGNNVNYTVSINASIDGGLLTFQGNGSSGFNYSGVLSDGATAANVTKTGSSTLSLSGANTFSGGLTLSQGTLNINNASALGATAGTFTMASGVKIDNTSGSTITNSQNNAQIWNGSFTWGGTNALNLGTGAVTLGADSIITVGGSGALTVGGVISDGVNSYGLTMGTPGSKNTGTLILANTSNSYDGGTVINSGFLQIAAAGSLGGSGANVTVNSGGAVNAAYALDQATLARLTSGSTGVIGLAANSSNNLDFSAATGANLGVTLGGTGTYSGILTPQGTTYRLGGAGGTLVMSNALADVSGSPTNLVVGAGGSSGTVTLNAAGTYSGGTTVVGAQGSTASKLQTNLLTGGANNTPFGTNAAIGLNNATLGLGTAATLASGNVMNVTGYDVTYTGQNTLQLAVGSGTSVTFAANSLNQSSAATDVLMFAPSSAVNFGTKEIVTVATGVPTVTNGMVAPNMVDSVNKTFLTYGASGKTGFSDATSTSVATSAAWTGLGTSAANTIVNFTGTGTIGLGTVNAYALIINNNQANVTGTVNVGSGGVIFVGNGGSSASIGLNFGSVHGYVGELGTGNFNYNGGISGTGGVTFYGTSSINYGGSATGLTGGITVAGPVSYDFNGSNALGTGNALTVTRSGALSFNRGITQTFSSLTGEGVVSANPAGNNASSTVTLAVNGNGPDTTFSGVLSGSLLAFSKAGTNTQILTGNNTYVKGTTVSGGILKGTQTSDTPFGTGNMAVGTGILSLAPGGSGANVVLTGANAASGSTFTFNAGAQVSLDKGGNTSLAYTVGNSAATANSVLVRGTNGTLIMAPASGLANLGTASGEKFIVNGGVTTTNGIVSASIIGQNTDGNKSGSFLGYDNTNGLVTGTYTDTNFASASSASVEDVTASTSVNTQTVYALRASAALTLNAAQTLTVGNGTLPAGVILNGGSITGGTALAFGASPGVIYSSLANGSIGSVITGSGGVSFVGPGVTTLTGTNTFSSTIINNSTVSVASVANNIGGNVTLNGGTLQTTATGSTSKTFSLNGGQASTGGTLDVAGGTTLTVSGVVSGAGSLTKANSGTLTVSGANTYTGSTVVNAGTLKAGVASVAGTSGAFGKNSAVVMADVAGATLDITGFNTQIGSLTGGGATGGNVTLGAATLITGADNTSPAAYAGVISGTGGLTKTGTGTQTLNAANTYSGTTTISAGTLALGSSGSIANSTVVNVGTSASQGILDLTAKSSFAFGSAQTLSGYGTVNIGSGKMITINGTLAPGNSPGVLNVTGDLTLGSSSTSNFEIISRNAGAPVAGTDFDRTAVTGALVFGGTLNINTTGLTGLISGDSFQLFTANSYTSGFTSVVMSGAYASTFTNNLGTWTGSNSGLNFTFTESTGILAVSAVPEPATFALFGGVLALGFAAWRRRRCA